MKEPTDPAARVFQVLKSYGTQTPIGISHRELAAAARCPVAAIPGLLRALERTGAIEGARAVSLVAAQPAA